MTISDQPLDTYTPAQYVALELERAAGAALSIDEMAATYNHSVGADIVRVRRTQACDERGAKRWLIAQAVSAFVEQGHLISDDAGYRYVDGSTLEDLRWGHRPIQRQDPNKNHIFNDWFNPLTGYGVIREVETIDKLRQSELYESMNKHGWLDDPIFDAVIDERGVVIVGRRRLAVASALGIEPHIRSKSFGINDLGDFQRFRLAIISNMGARSFTPSNNNRIRSILGASDNGSILESFGTEPASVENVQHHERDQDDSLEGLINQLYEVSGTDFGAVVLAWKERCGYKIIPSTILDRICIEFDISSKKILHNRMTKAKTTSRRDPKAMRNSTEVRKIIDDLWNAKGSSPTGREIIAAIKEKLELTCSPDTAESARQYVQGRRDERQLHIEQSGRV